MSGKLIPKFINFLNDGKKCTIQGSGETIRNFIFIDDVCSAIDYIIKRGTFGQIYNIGSDHCYEKSVIDVTKLLIKKIKNDDNYEKYIKYIEDRPFNDKRYLISNDKLKKLGWEQKVTFDEGINKLIKYINKKCVIIIKNKEINENKFDNIYENIKNKYEYDIIIENNINFPKLKDFIDYILNNDHNDFIIINDINNVNIDNFKFTFDDNQINLTEFKNLLIKLNINCKNNFMDENHLII